MPRLTERSTGKSTWKLQYYLLSSPKFSGYVKEFQDLKRRILGKRCLEYTQPWIQYKQCTSQSADLANSGVPVTFFFRGRYLTIWPLSHVDHCWATSLNHFTSSVRFQGTVISESEVLAALAFVYLRSDIIDSLSAKLLLNVIHEVSFVSY